LIKRLIIFVILLFSFLLGVASSEGSGQDAPKPAVYEVYALSYGSYLNFPVSGLIAGADKSRRLDLALMVWLLKGSNGRNILVDTGFYRTKFVKPEQLKDFIKVSDAVAKTGVKPEEITDIIISHMHWDHAGSMDQFPKARVWVQKDEYAYYTAAAWQQGGKSGGIDPEDVMSIVKRNTDKLVTLVDGDKEIIDGVSVYIGGRHTYQSQYASARTRSGTVVLASDNMYLYENLDKHLPISQTFDADSNLKAQDRMKQIASKPELIVPGHDPEVFVRFPRPGNGVARID